MSRLNVREIKGFSLDNYGNGVTKKDRTKDQETEVLVIPYKYVDGEYYFAQETVNFIKFTKQQNNGVNIEIPSDPNDIKIRSLNSFDILFMAK